VRSQSTLQRLPTLRGNLKKHPILSTTRYLLFLNFFTQLIRFLKRKNILVQQSLAQTVPHSPHIHKMYFLYARVVGIQVVGENTSLFCQWRPHHRTFRHSSEMTTFWSSSFLPNQKQFFTFCSRSPRPVLAFFQSP
jgi:hypothetical protein